LNETEEILEKVQTYIKDRRRFLPILNNSFHRDPDPGKAKFLVLRFKNDVTISVREKLVVDFAVVEKILRKRNGSVQKKTSTSVVHSRKVCIKLSCNFSKCF